MGWTIEVLGFISRQRPGIFLFTAASRLAVRAHPASYPVGTGCSFPGMKRPGREDDHSPLSSVEVKNAWSYTSIPQYVSMAWRVIKHRDIFALSLPPTYA
jgi:hypothetical protein